MSTMTDHAAALTAVQDCLDGTVTFFDERRPHGNSIEVAHRTEIAANVVRELRRKLDLGLGADAGVRFRRDGEPEPHYGPIRRRPARAGAEAPNRDDLARRAADLRAARDALRQTARALVRAFPERRAVAEKLDTAVRRVDEAALWLDCLIAGKAPPTLTAIFGEAPTLAPAAA